MAETVSAASPASTSCATRRRTSVGFTVSTGRSSRDPKRRTRERSAAVRAADTLLLAFQASTQAWTVGACGGAVAATVPATPGPTTATWAVPEDLRPYYAAAEPTEVERRGYIASGADITEDISGTVDRVVDPGDLVRAPRVVQEDISRKTLVHYSGASGYQPWLHQNRLGHAINAKRQADRQAQLEAQWGTCQMCGVRSGSVTRQRLHVPGQLQRPHPAVAVACPDCRHLLVDTMQAELATRHANQVLPDGRRTGDVAADLVRSLLDPKEDDA